MTCVAAVADAVREGRRLVVTSGGHCLEGFVSDPEVKVIVDVSPMKGIAFDAERGAVAVRGGRDGGRDVPGARTTTGAWSSRWASTPASAWAGTWPAARSGSSAASSASPRTTCTPSRSSPWTRTGGPRVVVATREPSDPNRELWWALTGAGGGNFGVVTRFWFRSPGASGADPATLLPRAPRIDHDVPGGVELERHRSGVLPAPGPQPRRSGASGPATPIRPTPRSGRCSRSIASSSGRSSSAASARPATPPSGRWTTSSPRSARGPSRRRPRTGTDVVARLRAEPVPGPVHDAPGRRLRQR